jgi:hypothetical protein
LWHDYHRARQARNKKICCRPSNGRHPLSGLLYDALDGTRLHALSTRGANRRYLVSSGAVEKRPGSKWRTFDLAAFTKGLLSQLSELSATDLFRDPGAARVTEIERKLSEVERRLAAAVARFDAEPESSAWADQVSRYDRERRSLLEQLKEARLEAQHPLSAVWAEAVEAMAAENPDRLRSAVLATVEEIRCVFVRLERSAG